MLAVIFEVEVKSSGIDEYLRLAANLREEFESTAGCLSIERFQSLANGKKLVSLSFWDTDESITDWRNNKRKI